MNANRNRYTSAPLYGMKNKKNMSNHKTAPAEQNPASYANAAPQMPPQNTGNMQPNPYQPNQSAGGYPQNPRDQYGSYWANTPAGGNNFQNNHASFNPSGVYTQNPQEQNYTAPQQNYPYGQSYQPQPYPKTPDTSSEEIRGRWMIPVVLAVLPILFILSLVFSNFIVRCIFLGCAALSLIIMWAGKFFAKNIRCTVSLIYAALVTIVAAALIVSMPTPESRSISARLPSNEELFGGNSGLSSSIGSVAQNPVTNENENENIAVPAAPEETPVTSPAEIQLNTFMNYWAESQLDQMVNLCLPSWVAGLENPKVDLFMLLANRTPLSYTVEKISGSDADSSRTITLTVLIDKKSTTEPSYYQMQVLMLRINDSWYVDPNSLGGTKLDNTPNANAVDPGYIPYVPTEAPTLPPQKANPDILYYNPDGGQYYHADANCPSVDKKYRPLSPFNFSDLNNTKFKNLLPCSECHAPNRPVITGD